jgi:hypothetical protein
MVDHEVLLLLLELRVEQLRVQQRAKEWVGQVENVLLVGRPQVEERMWLEAELKKMKKTKMAMARMTRNLMHQQ